MPHTQETINKVRGLINRGKTYSQAAKLTGLTVGKIAGIINRHGKDIKSAR